LKGVDLFMDQEKNINQFGELPYSYDALEPFIDKETMFVHHTKHHRAYYDKFLTAIEGTSLEKKAVTEILKDLSLLPEERKQAIINNGGGYFNHNFFFDILSSKSTKKPFENLEKEINNSFESFEKFKEEFKEKALTLFGSGWVWLVLNKEGKLEIIQTKNQDSPLSLGLKPILALDVWEHAYYLKYQNKRADYVDAFWNVVNWKQAEYLFNSYL
jgi:superoxide dismutase, Fe-Mn family